MPSLQTFITLLASGATVLGAALPEASPVAPQSSCTTGTPVTTAGYPIPFYAQATPTDGSFVNGYQPEPRWASQHLVGTYVSYTYPNLFIFLPLCHVVGSVAVCSWACIPSLLYPALSYEV